MTRITPLGEASLCPTLREGIPSANDCPDAPGAEPSEDVNGGHDVVRPPVAAVDVDGEGAPWPHSADEVMLGDRDELGRIE